MNTRKQFEKNGYVILKNFLSNDEISRLKDIIDREAQQSMTPYFPRDVHMLLPSQVFKHPEMALLPFKKRALEALREALGPDLCYIQDFHVQINMVGVNEDKNSPGWHVDSGSEEPADYLTQRDYKFAKVGVYLQDNSEEWGGGISLLPKGHKFPIKTGNTKLDYKIKNLWWRLRLKFFGKAMRSKAGDLLFFDSRLPHTSTLPRDCSSLKVEENLLTGFPQGVKKYAIFWNACGVKMAPNFLQNAEKRSLAERKGQSLFFTDFLKNHYPEDLPQDFVQAADQNDVKIASLSSSKCKTYKTVFAKKT